MSYLKGFKIKKHGTCNALKIENTKEAINKVLRRLKSRRKVRIKHFKVKLTGARVSRGYLRLAKCHLHFREFKVLVDVINQQAT